VTQTREGAGLGLLHGLAREPKGATDLLQGARGLPVEAVAGGEERQGSRAGTARCPVGTAGWNSPVSCWDGASAPS